MTANLKTATSAIPGVQFAGQLATSETALFTVPAGAAFVGTLTLTNVTGSPATALVSKVKSGGTGGTTNRVRVETLTAGQSIEFKVQLGEGDFLSGQSGTATAITAVLDGTTFSNSPGATLSGIQDDAIGSGAWAASGTVTGTNDIGTGANRYIIGALLCNTQPNWRATVDYTTLTMTCGGVSMAKLASADWGIPGNRKSTVHLFGLANPASGTAVPLVGTAAAAGGIGASTLASMSLTGVGSVTGATSYSPGSSAPLNYSVSPTGAGQRAIYAIGSEAAMKNFNRHYRSFNGDAPSSAAAFLTLADWVSTAAGALAATTADSQYFTGVGAVLVPA